MVNHPSFSFLHTLPSLYFFSRLRRLIFTKGPSQQQLSLPIWRSYTLSSRSLWPSRDRFCQSNLLPASVFYPDTIPNRGNSKRGYHHAPSSAAPNGVYSNTATFLAPPSRRPFASV